MNTALSASQSDTENTCCLFVAQHLHQSLEKLSEFVAVDPVYSYCGPLSLDATDFENCYPTTKYFALQLSTQSVTALQRTYRAQF